MKNLKYNRELSVIDTEEKAYLLGQIYGDGCNCKTKRKDKGGNSYRIILASINTDRPLYEKINSAFPFLKIATYSSHPNVIYLTCSQKKLYEDLANLGMISNKATYDKTGEFHFPELKEELIHHFIRGYFDADGSCWYPTRKRSRNNIHIEFGCSTKNFIIALNSILNKNGINFTYKEKSKTAGNGKSYDTYNIYSCNREQSIKFADYIYNNATIFLDRKKELCYREPELRPTASEVYGNCPHCGSSNIWRAGIRMGKRRLRCLNCGKRFTRPLPK